MAHQMLRLRCQSVFALARLGRDLNQDLLGEGEDITRSLPQGRDPESDDIEPIEEIQSEPLFPGQGLQVFR